MSFGARPVRLLLVALPLAGCGDGTTIGATCTEIGCIDQLRITLDAGAIQGVPITRYDLTVAIDGTSGSTVCEPNVQQSTIQELDLSVQCNDTEIVLFTNATSVVVDVASPDFTGRLDAATYQEVRPNGPSCEPVCMQGDETIALQPAGGGGGGN